MAAKQSTKHMELSKDAHIFQRNLKLFFMAYV